MLGEGWQGRGYGRIIYVWEGPEGAWRWRHTLIRGWTGSGCGGGRGYFFEHLFGSEGSTFM